MSYLWPQRPSGFFGGPRVTAYVQVYDKADPPVGRTAVTGLPASAFSAVEDGQAVSVTAKPVAPDDPVALIVVADTSTARGWLGSGPKYPDAPVNYLRDTTLRVLKEFPQNGVYSVYTMANDAGGTPPLGDRAKAEGAAQQMQANPDARLLERLERAVEALKDAPPAMRRVVVVLSDGNSAFGRNYELVQGTAQQARVAVFAVSTVDPNNPFRFLERMGQETGGQGWFFDKADLQPQPTSPVMLDLLADQAIKAIKSAYRLDYSPPRSGLEARELVVTVKTPAAGDIKARTPYRGQPSSGPSTSLLLLLIGVPLLAIAAGGAFYYLRLRPAKSDYYLVGHGPSSGHVPEQYLYTDWRPLGRGGRGYQLTPEDPHFSGLSKTHVWLHVHNLRRVTTPTGHAQTVGTVEAKAGKPSSGVGLNTTFVYNEISGVRPLSEHPYQLQTGDLLILQPASRQGQSLNGLPPGVYLRLGVVGGTAVEPSAPEEPVDADRTIVESVADHDRTVIEPIPGVPRPAVPGARLQPGLQPPPDADRTQIGQPVPIPPHFPNGGGQGERR